MASEPRSPGRSSERGAKVGLIARHEERLRETESELPGRSASRAAHIGDREAIRTAIDELTEELGGLDVLVNDAGFTRYVFSRPGGLAYAAAKSGVIGLTYALARELSPRGITANAIAPGFIPETGFFGPDGVPDDHVKAVSEQTPLGRPGQPEDIAGAAVCLALDAASFVTGQVIQVNGGWNFGR